MKVKITTVTEMEFDQLNDDVSYNDKNYVIRNKMDKLISCGGGDCKEIYWEEIL